VAIIEWESTARNAPRRWQDLAITPYGDAISQNKWRYTVSNPAASKNCLMVSINFNNLQAVQFDAIRGIPGKPDGSYERFVGACDPNFTTAPNSLRVVPPFENMASPYFITKADGNGYDADYLYQRRHKFRVELSATWLKVYEQGVLRVNQALPTPI